MDSLDLDVKKWLDYLDSLDNSSPKNNKKRKLSKINENRLNNYNELRVTGIDNLFFNISDMKLKGRDLTNFLSKLEYTFRTTKDLIKKDSKSNSDYLIYLLLALCSIMIELIQDLKLSSYDEGRKFNPLKWLKNLRKDISGSDKPEKIIKKQKNSPINFMEIEFSTNKYNNHKKDDEDTDEVDNHDEDNDEVDNYDEDNDKVDNDETYEKLSEVESTDDESNYTKDGYIIDDFVTEEQFEDEDDYFYNTHIEKSNVDVDEEEEYEEEDYEEEDYEEEDYENDIVEQSGSNNIKLNKIFLREFNKFKDKNNSSSDEAIKYYCSLDKDIRLEFLDKIRELNSSGMIIEPLLFKIIKLNISKDQKNHIIGQYFNTMNSMADNTKLKNWLNNVMKIPYEKYKGTDLDKINKKDIPKFIKKLKSKMDMAVHGHDQAKRKIIQMMGQQITNPKSKGGVLGIWGPPGNGKTTLIKEGIAKAMDKPFVFISLGGAQDASFLEGHSFTYEGSICGRIMNGLMESKCMNPIIYFDELDKISKTTRGDEITNLLVHLIDPVQNCHFRDKYFHGLDFDLSRVTFIFSFNEPQNVNHILMDRITTVQTKFLSPSQKLMIANKYLMPNIFKDIGLKNDSVIISDKIINNIIKKYTWEGGVRKLKTMLYSIVRELNVRNLINSKVFNKKVKFPFRLKNDHIRELVKEYDEMEKNKIHQSNKVGIVNGMWANSLGMGGILSIETMLFPSKSPLEIKATGSLEKVIKESIEVACSLAWSKIDEERKNYWMGKWKDKPEGFHIHCPEGATPKDGPSAGAALTLAIYSVLMNRKINNEISMTGEINLKGKVTKIGGLEEKLQGAKYAGVKLALVPKDNEKDLIKIRKRNANLLDDDFKVVIVEKFSDVMKHALV
jgi:endopeptidase La